MNISNEVNPTVMAAYITAGGAIVASGNPAGWVLIWFATITVMS